MCAGLSNSVCRLDSVCRTVCVGLIVCVGLSNSVCRLDSVCRLVKQCV